MNKIELRKNSGRAFQIEGRSERTPKYIGKAVVAGREWRVAVWSNEARNGKEYLNFDFDEPWVWVNSND